MSVPHGPLWGRCSESRFPSRVGAWGQEGSHNVVPNFIFWNMIRGDAWGWPQDLPVSCEFSQLTKLSLDNLHSPLLVPVSGTGPSVLLLPPRVVPPASSCVFILLTHCGVMGGSKKGRSILQKQTHPWAAILLWVRVRHLGVHQLGSLVLLSYHGHYFWS